MQSPHTLEQALDNLMKDQYRDPKDFNDFAGSLLRLGITRFHFDALSDAMHFYTSDAHCHSIIRRDLQKARAEEKWVFGKAFDSQAVASSIQEFDAKRLSPTQFHKALFFAGVARCDIYLTTRKIFYFGDNGNYFLENY